MKNRLIALIDFSVYSHALAELAIQWCHVSKAELVFVHQVIGIYPAFVDETIKRKVLQEEERLALDKLKTFVSDKNFPEENVKYIVTDAHLLNTIKELSKDGYNDMILVGIRGTGMLKQLLIGHTATMIIDETDHTVVAVPDKLCARGSTLCNLLPKRVIISLSYRFPLNEKALDDFLEIYTTEITQLEFISSIDDELEEEAIKYLSRLSKKYSARKASYQIFKGGNHFEQIKNHVQREPDTIMIVQKGSRNLTDHLFRRFLINEVIHDGSLPMVVLPQLKESTSANATIHGSIA